MIFIIFLIKTLKEKHTILSKRQELKLINIIKSLIKKPKGKNVNNKDKTRDGYKK